MNRYDIFDPGHFFSGTTNPADSAMPYMNQAQGVLQNTYNPYMQQGQAAYGQLSNQYNNMSQDPAAYLQNIMKGYQPSQGYQFKQNQMLKAAGNSAAAGGTKGNIGDIQNQAHLTDTLMGDDMQQWLQNVMGIQGAGMQGQQGFYNTGYDAAKNYGSDMSNLYGSEAQLGYKGAEEKNKGIFDKMGGAGGLIGGIASFF